MSHSTAELPGSRFGRVRYLLAAAFRGRGVVLFSALALACGVAVSQAAEVRFHGLLDVVAGMDSTLEVTLIEQDRATVEDLRMEVPEVNVMLGDACEPWVLDDADLAHADVVVAATGDDEDNLVTSLLAKQEFAVPRVLARVNHPKNEANPRAQLAPLPGYVP